jgi:hypothetical protein
MEIGDKKTVRHGGDSSWSFRLCVIPESDDSIEVRAKSSGISMRSRRGHA